MNVSENERAKLLDLYEGLRVADVRDGMDWNMMHHYGSMSFQIRPIFRTRAFGIARTARYLAFEGSVPKMSPEDYTEWAEWYYRNVCTYPWINEIQDGDFCVIDQSGIDAGVMGSNNSLICMRNGARGFVTNGGVRDSDELIIQKVPVWAGFISQKMDQGRVRFDAKDIPINVGGVVVSPGDVIVADGDGVIAVPRKIAFEVAKYAHQEREKDKVARRKLYQELGMNFDDTVL